MSRIKQLVMLYMETQLTHFVGYCYKLYKAFVAYFQEDGYVSYHTDHRDIFICGANIKLFNLYWIKNVKNIRLTFDCIINKWTELVKMSGHLKQAKQQVVYIRKQMDTLMNNIRCACHNT